MKYIKKIEYLPDEDDLTVWFKGSDEPFSPKEFISDSGTGYYLDLLWDELTNIFAELENQGVFNES